uniref:Uncharacterized protein n=1 Tax=Lepeophtheirus salmonis TaxID=72036 RepID=A0A0K2T9D5_LEPSM
MEASPGEVSRGHQCRISDAKDQDEISKPIPIDHMGKICHVSI